MFIKIEVMTCQKLLFPVFLCLLISTINVWANDGDPLILDWIQDQNPASLNSPQSGYLEELNDRLKQWNAGRPDHLRIYVLIAMDVRTVAAKNVKVDFNSPFLNTTSSEPVNAMDKAFKAMKMKSEDISSNININDAIRAIHQKLAAKGYTERVIYTYGTQEFIDGKGHSHHRTLDQLSVSGKLMSMPGLSDRIWKRAQETPTAQAKTHAQRISLAIDNIIKAIEQEYDFGKAVKNCSVGSDFINTWPVSDDRYKEAVVLTAKYYALTDAKYQLGSKYLKVDDLRRFRTDALTVGDAVFSGKGPFFSEAFPDVLNSLPGYSDYTVYAIFKEVNFYIPPKERMKFAQDVYAQLKSTGSLASNVILLVVPYFVCTPGSSSTSLVFMPAVSGADKSLSQAMNSPFAETEDFCAAFREAMKAVPKDHISYVAFYLWNGTIIFKQEIDKRVRGFSNCADIYVLVDQRADAIQPYMHCWEKYPASSDPLEPSYRIFTNCLSESRAAIDRLILDSPEPQFRILNPPDDCYKSQMRQKKLLGEDGPSLALTYAHAALYNADLKAFSVDRDVNAGRAGAEDSFLEDELFYGNQNPFHVKHWVYSVVKVGSFIAGFLGPTGLLYDFAAGMIILAVGGDTDEAIGSFTNVLVPIALYGTGKIAVKGFRYLKNFAVGEEAYKAVTHASFPVLSNDGRMLVAGTNDGLNLVTGVMGTDGAGALRAAGVSLETVEAMPAAVRSKVQEALVNVEGNKIVSRGAVNGISAKELVDAASDKELIRQFGEALSQKQALTFVEFIETVRRNLQKSQIFLAGAADDLLKTARGLLPQEGYMDVFLRYNGYNFVADGKELTLTEVIARIRNNPDWGKRPLRFIVAGEGDAKAAVQGVLDDLKVQGKINPASEIGLTKEGCLAGTWTDMAPMPPRILFQTDEVLAEIAKYIKYDSRYIYVFIHGNDEGFYLVMEGLNVFISHLQVADWLVSQPVFVEALKAGKIVRLISCCAAASDAAKNLSVRLLELSKMAESKIAGLSATLEAPTVPYGFHWDTKGTIYEGSPRPNGKWHTFRDGESLGPVKENPDIPQFPAGGRSTVASSTTTTTDFHVEQDGDSWDIFVPGIAERVATGELTSEGYITSYINVKIGDGNARVAQGKDVFNKLFSVIEENNPPNSIKGIIGEWLPVEDARSNLDKLNKLITDNVNKGTMTLDEAILGTYTGTWAQEKEFRKVKILYEETVIGEEKLLSTVRNDDGTFESIKVLFYK